VRDFPEPWGSYLLGELFETTAPASVSWWPETIAWKVLCVVIIFSACHKAYRHYQLYKANSYRREALLWLKQLPEYDSAAPANDYRQLPALLRTTALQAFDRNEINQLSSGQWEEWLDQQCEDSAFENSCPSLLYQLAYTPRCQISQQQMERLISEITQWVKYHRGYDD
jgi:Domain of unknown function (DUF4381)